MSVDDKCHGKIKQGARQGVLQWDIILILSSQPYEGGIVNHTHFVGEKTEAQGGKVTCLNRVV